MSPTIRLATSADVPLLVDLMHEFYAESHVPLDRHEAGASFAHLLGDRTRGAVWLLAAGQAPAGYVVLTVGFSMEYGGLDAFVDDLFVRPAFRRKGFAAQPWRRCWPNASDAACGRSISRSGATTTRRRPCMPGSAFATTTASF